MLNSIEQYIGKYYSISWVRKNILRQTEDDISKIDKEVAAEQNQLQDLKVAQTAETDDEAIDAEQDKIDLESPLVDNTKKE
jgi:septal ring factor EnvC (AmiA/AmiB activator)